MNVVFNYMTTNLLNGKQYIGMHSTNNLDDGYIGTGTLLSRAIKKYGKENFKRIILCIVESKKIAYNNEAIFIKKYNTLIPNGYNISPSGGIGLNQIISYETRQKISKAQLGRTPWNKGKKLSPLSDETKKKLSESSMGEGNPFYGERHSIETKEKISKANKGQVPWNKGLETPLEVREKSSKAHMGQHSSPETEFKKGQKAWNVNTEITKDFLYTEYCLKGKSSLIIAKEIGVCKGTILNYLKRFKIYTRTPSEATKNFINRKLNGATI